MISATPPGRRRAHVAACLGLAACTAFTDAAPDPSPQPAEGAAAAPAPLAGPPATPATSARTRCPASPTRATDNGHPAVEESAPAAKPGPGAAAPSTTPRDTRIRALLDRLGPRLSRSGAGLTIEAGTGGARVLHLDNRFHHALVARRETDGSVRHACVGNRPYAEAFLQGGGGAPR